MYKLTLREKTGFQVVDPTQPVIIRDYRGVLFYSTEPMLPRVMKFNLPAGEFFVDAGYIRRMSSPNPVTLSRLPFPERFYPSTSDFNVQFGTNPNKCTVFWDEKLILFDKSFLDKPLPQIDFIRLHEEGHSRYETEKYADLYAANAMLEKGYNESQIGTAHIDSLSSNQYERKEYILNRIIRRNFKRHA